MLISMVILDDTAYHYAKRDNQSLTCRFVKNYFELQEMRINELLGFYRENGMCDGDILKNLAGIYVRSVFSALEKNNRQTLRNVRERQKRLAQGSA